MTKLKAEDKWVRDFGFGVTDDPEKAHDFTPDEALALGALFNLTKASEGEPLVLGLTNPPLFNPGDGYVWVRYNGVWFAAERQALFLGTRNALKAHGVQEPMIA